MSYGRYYGYTIKKDEEEGEEQEEKKKGRRKEKRKRKGLNSPKYLKYKDGIITTTSVR